MYLQKVIKQVSAFRIIIIHNQQLLCQSKKKKKKNTLTQEKIYEIIASISTPSFKITNQCLEIICRQFKWFQKEKNKSIKLWLLLNTYCCLSFVLVSVCAVRDSGVQYLDFIGSSSVVNLNSSQQEARYNFHNMAVNFNHQMLLGMLFKWYDQLGHFSIVRDILIDVGWLAVIATTTMTTTTTTIIPLQLRKGANTLYGQACTTVT